MKHTERYGSTSSLVDDNLGGLVSIWAVCNDGEVGVFMVATITSMADSEMVDVSPLLLP